MIDQLLIELFGMSFQELFLDPLSYQFIKNAMLAVILVGGISGVIGSFVVVRGMSFFGDALAHTVLPGVAIAYMQGQGLFWGGLAAGIGSALGIGLLTRNEKIKEDTAIGVVFAGMFALGIALISSTSGYYVDLTHILFGNVLAVSPADLRLMQICGVIVVGTVLLFYKEFLVISFDPELARTLRLPREALRFILLILIAITIVASLQTVGVALMLAMLITPAATAQLLVKRLHYMLLVSAVLGILSGITGLYISYYQEITSGAAIVLTSTSMFLAVFTLAQLRNWLHLRWA
jgi:ABC-type Mn2+/Zn2+ transport system permease subunit